MRNSAWHLWKPTSEHSIRIRHLVDINHLTTAWLKDLELEQDQGEYKLRRVFSPGAKENLDMLERLTKAAVPTHINAILNDLSPDEFIERLESVIWSAQAWSLSRVYTETPQSERMALKSELIKSSFKSGRHSAQTRWPYFPNEGRKNLRVLYSSLRDTPFAGYPHTNGFLLRRGVHNFVEFELLQCPHRTELPEVKAIADDLCLFQSHWIRGYIYELNTEINFDYFPCCEISKRKSCVIQLSLAARL